ncbi:cation transporter [Acinetobacter sp. A2]|uniref:cation transporter n=1 Tax=Acinetobacter sp. A2 TaxID=362457 RepID=UPI003AF390A0
MSSSTQDAQSTQDQNLKNQCSNTSGCDGQDNQPVKSACSSQSAGSNQSCGSDCATSAENTADSCCSNKSCANTNNAQSNANVVAADQIPLSPWVSAYNIPKMDCGAEEQMVRIALADHNDIAALSFDLAARHLKVYHHTRSVAEITEKLETLGLGAVLEQTEANTQTELPITDSRAQRKVLYALLGINAVMFLVELIAGLIASSTGLIADSLDMFADAAVYGLALFVVGQSAKKQLKAAHLSGWVQLALAAVVIVDVLRRFFLGSEPESMLMMLIGAAALVANVTCLWLISGHKDGGTHMQASYIFSANDVIVNLGVIIAGGLVLLTGSNYPDLIIGLIVAMFVLNGARKILSLK